MSSTSLLRIAARAQPSTFFRANGIRNITPRSSSAVFAIPALIATSGSVSTFSTSSRMRSDAHDETFEEFTARYAACQLASPRPWGSTPGTIPHSRNTTKLGSSIANESTRTIDTRRNSTRFKMSLSFRYVEYIDGGVYGSDYRLLIIVPHYSEI